MTRRILLGFLALLAAFFLLLVVMLTWVLATESGLRTAWNTASGFAPGLSAKVIKGKLTGPLKLRDVAFKTETFELLVHAADFNWLPSKLWQRQLVVDQLHVSGVRYTQLKPAPPEEDKEPFSLPDSFDLPVSIALRNIMLKDVEYRSAVEAAPIVLDNATLAATFSDSKLNISKFKATGPLFELGGKGNVETQGAYASGVEIDVLARLPGYAPATGVINVNGDLEELQIKQTLATPYNVTLNATLRNVMEKLKFDAKLATHATQLQAIGSELPQVMLNLSAKAGGEPNDLGYAVNLTADVAEMGTIELSTNGGFAEQLLSIQQLLVKVAESPAMLEAQGKVNFSQADTVLDIASNWKQLRWPLHGADPLIVSPTGTVDVSGTLNDLAAALRVGLYNKGQIKGNVRRKDETIDVALDWQDLSWPIKKPQVGSPSGKFSLTGKLQDYTLRADAKLKLPQNTEGKIRLEGSGSTEKVALPVILLDVLEGQIKGRADVAWQPALQADVALRGKNLDPAILAQQWPGNLQFELAANVDQREKNLTASLNKLSVTGRLRDQPVDLTALAEFRDQVLRIKRFTAQSGPSTVQADGKLGETLALDWRIDSPDLSTLMPQAGGSVKGSGKVGGTLSMPALQADLRAKDIAYADYSLAQLELDADVDLQRKSPSKLSLVIKDAKAAGVDIDKVALNGSGTRHIHQLSLNATSSVANANVDLSGDLQQNKWAITLTAAQLKYAELAAWNLNAPQAASIGTTQQALEKGCWTSAEASMCLQGERNASELQASVAIDGLPFAYFASLMPANIAVQGELNGNADVSQQTGQQLSLEVDLKTTASELRAVGIGGDEQADPQGEAQPAQVLLALEPATIQATLGDEGLSALVNLPFVNQGGITGKASVPAGSAPLAERPLSGSIDIAVADLGFIAALSPEIEKIGGGIQGDIQLAGTLAKPEPNGKLKLSNGLAMLAAPGLTIKDLELQASANASGSVDFDGSANSGKGSIELTGEADLSGEAITTTLAVTGDKFQVFNTRDARVYISPDLKVAVDAQGIGVSGSVTVPKAAITPKKLPESAVSVSKDQVIITDDANNTEAAATRDLHARVQLILGDNVKVDGFGFKGGVTGELTVTQEPGEPTIGTGELDIVDGEYRAYGQGLVVEKGRILFAGGPVNQPGVNIRAVRKPAEDILVGVQVRGSLQQPDFTVFSEPSMSQSEQLAWLVLGRSLQGSSDAEGDLVTQAALALGLKGGNFLADRIGGNLGVDTFGIETGSGEAGAASDVNQAAFVIGKYLSPELYVSYGIGLFESVSTVKLEYTVSDHWKVATESSTLSSGGDIIYTIER